MTTEPVFGPFTVRTLVDNLDRLSARDQEFARGLLDTFERCRAKGWDLKPGTARWLAIMADRATRDARPAPARTQIGDFAPIAALFDRFPANLRNPALLIPRASDPARAFRLKVARSGREPGSIFVTDAEAGEDGREYFGRLSRDGSFAASRNAHGTEIEQEVVASLARFAADPAREAARYGRLTGRCCACGRTLKDRHGRSQAVGYGPDCAERLGWPYPKASEVDLFRADAA